MNEARSPLLRIDDLVLDYETEAGPARALDHVSLSVEHHSTVAVVGESGCGKSSLALAIMRLLPESQARIVQGSVEFDGLALTQLPEKKMRPLRGSRIAMVFQEPSTCLNPVYSVGWQIIEGIRAHQRVSGKQARQLALDALRRVGIQAPEQRIDCYPHQLSGGMRQRVMIAMALACNPQLLIADEPTTALDVTTQAQVLELLVELQRESGLTLLLITHDLAIVASFAQRVVVMYAGRVVEDAPVTELFAHPEHPYTQGLIQSIPSMQGPAHAGQPLPTIPGRAPDLRTLPPGCKFRDRCPVAIDKCATAEPPLLKRSDNHHARCWLLEAPST